LGLVVNNLLLELFSLLYFQYRIDVVYILYFVFYVYVEEDAVVIFLFRLNIKYIYTG